MKTIQLKQYGMGRYGDVSPFPMGDLELELQGLPSYEGEFRFVAQCNGVKCAECRVTPVQNRKMDDNGAVLEIGQQLYSNITNVSATFGDNTGIIVITKIYKIIE